MAEIPGIVACFLGPAKVVEKCIPEPIKVLFTCLCGFDNNIDNLRDESRTLELARAYLMMRVTADKNRRRVINPQVMTWLEDVNAIQEKMPEIEIEIATVSSHFSLTKKVKEIAEAMEELRQSSNFFYVSQPVTTGNLSERIMSSYRGILDHFCKPKGMPEYLYGVYKRVKKLYESLNCEPAKSLFLLCCLYREHSDIPLEELTDFAIGLGMLEHIASLEQARNVVRLLVQMLKSRFLLVEGRDKNHVRMCSMGDGIRDASIFIASNEKRIHCKHRTWISPYTGEGCWFPAGSTYPIFPNLRLIWLIYQSEICDEFFQETRELNVLYVLHPSLTQLPRTTELLKNLRTLIFDTCTSLVSIPVVGELVNLEILIFRSCISIENLIVEIGRLVRLRLLELSNCFSLKTIAPGVISSLIGLEELIVSGFNKWDASTLSEIQSLPRLTRLEIETKYPRLAADQEMHISTNMAKYDITIGDIDIEGFSFDRFEKKMRVKLAGNTTHLGNWFHGCVENVECTLLEGDFPEYLCFRLAQNMRWLIFRHCSTVKRLVNITTSATVFPLLEALWLENLTQLEEMWDIDYGMSSNSLRNLKELILESLPALEHLYQIEVVSVFGKLSAISISRCNRLSSICALSLAAGGCASQLQSLEIYSCDMMEQVFLWDEEENVTPIFPKLKTMILDSLPKLTSFCKGIRIIQFPMMEEMEIRSCPLLKIFTPNASHGAHGSVGFFSQPSNSSSPVNKKRTQHAQHTPISFLDDDDAQSDLIEPAPEIVEIQHSETPENAPVGESDQPTERDLRELTIQRAQIKCTFERLEIDDEEKVIDLGAVGKGDQGEENDEKGSESFEDKEVNVACKLDDDEEKLRSFNLNNSLKRIDYPMIPYAEDCAYYMKFGRCKFGLTCKFNHSPRRKNQGVKERTNHKEENSERRGQTECKYYLTSRGCKYGKDCKYSHGSERSSTTHMPEFNFLGLPIRIGEKECPYYMRNGACKYGTNCRFHHPDPVTVAC